MLNPLCYFCGFLFNFLNMSCVDCKETCIKRGVRNGVQLFQCKNCRRRFQETYRIQRVSKEKQQLLILLIKVGVGIRGIAKTLQISPTTVVRQIRMLSSQIKQPVFADKSAVYEVDELRTFVGNKKKECWITYALNRKTGKVEGFVIGSRSKMNIGKLIENLLLNSPKHIYTDGLNIYPSLVPQQVHRVFKRCTNKIERHNLTLRTHLKRLSRRTICFSRSTDMLESCLKLYVWG